MKFTPEEVMDGLGRLIVLMLFASIMLASCAPELIEV